MLIGPSTRPLLPQPPRDDDDLRTVIRYLQDMAEVMGRFQSAIVVNTVGAIGLRGLSSTGTVSQNLTQSFDISNATRLLWTFTGFEADTSYMIYSMQTKQSWSSFITETTKTTTDVLFTFGSPVASGTIMHVLLMR